MNKKPHTRKAGAIARTLRAGIVGTGYIAEFHARAVKSLPNVELVSVCDLNLRSAQSFAAAWGIAKTYDSLELMLHTERLDAIHVLAPPDLHFSLAKLALQCGVHVFLEKPMCVSVNEADKLLKLARDTGLHLGVNHNFLFSGGYQRLRDAVHAAELGPLDYVSLNHFFEMKQIRFGPYDTWMLRAPENVLLEIGPHFLSAMFDLVGMPDGFSVTADRPFPLPNGSYVLRRWRTRATVGRTAVDINIDLGPGFGQRTIAAHGLFGSAMVDLDANTCVIDRPTPLSFELDHYRRTRSLASQLRQQARATITDSILSKLKLRARGNPYQVSIGDSIAAYYSALAAGTALDRRIDGEFARSVIKGCTDIIRAAKIKAAVEPKTAIRRASSVRPTVLVLGGSGFIGRELIQQLLAGGYDVRAMMRGSGTGLEGLDNGHMEIFRGDLRNADDLKRALAGIDFVYHLATSETKTWDESLRNIVEPTRQLAQACLEAGVKRLIYTGTIDSYYAGANAGTITEETPLDRNITRRNYYARAKAASENILTEMHERQRLPVVIFRPGIVIGRGGNPFHWGVGKFSENICQVWGNGDNKLPLVLVADVAAALVRGIQVPGLEGRSYNLIDVPLLSANEYLIELQRLARIKLCVKHRPIWRFYATDFGKWVLKLAVGHPDRLRRPSYQDWESRTQKAFFDCDRARTDLGWAPASDRERMVKEGIGGSLESWQAACM